MIYSLFRCGDDSVTVFWVLCWVLWECIHVKLRTCQATNMSNCEPTSTNDMTLISKIKTFYGVEDIVNMRSDCDQSSRVKSSLWESVFFFGYLVNISPKLWKHKSKFQKVWLHNKGYITDIDSAFWMHRIMFTYFHKIQTKNVDKLIKSNKHNTK